MPDDTTTATTTKSPFPHPWWVSYSFREPLPKCKDEWLINDISNSIREKLEWRSKYKDPIISEKWKQEVNSSLVGKTKIPNEIISYVLEELKWYDKMAVNIGGGFAVGCDPKIVFSDSCIGEETNAELKRLSDLFQLDFGEDIDYHPGSNDTVIDLVHPSLFPLQYGKTPIYGTSDKTKLEMVEFSEDIYKVKEGVSFGTSKRFQWLPALFELNLENKNYEIKSYINNLDPIEYTNLYEIIAKIFNLIIPGLNHTLSAYGSTEYLKIEIPIGDDAYEENFMIEFDRKMEELDMRHPEASDEEYEALERTKVNGLKKFMPKYPAEPRIDKTIDVKDFQQLKVIVKMANIELTPDKPRYEGGSWHVEGTINEDIVATVLYYYDCENITDSYLKFRCSFGDPNYPQNDEIYPREIYGIENEDIMVREIGHVQALTNRIVVFPNIFQHQVQPFELLDKSKPGRRRILCFFVVDPYNQIVKSTLDVPPQQLHWWENESLTQKLGRLSVADTTKLNKQSLEVAYEIRKQLMEERSPGNDPMCAFSNEFSLCEH
ncbi:uncharacterized protein RJT21DRAFT_113538 [Scheffersomyces amazonensis]|uniref:uncharacterized protein n=1 Tax=Scheffersomyces amazonensis TaxID=1078765 RepID=UPI00315D12AF